MKSWKGWTPINGIYDVLNKGLHHAAGSVIGLLIFNDDFACDGVFAEIAEEISNPIVDAV